VHAGCADGLRRVSRRDPLWQRHHLGEREREREREIEAYLGPGQERPLWQGHHLPFHTLRLGEGREGKGGEREGRCEEARNLSGDSG
jgi:hypothetical protein